MSYFKRILPAVALALTMGACVNDLDRLPTYDVTSASVYANAANYKPVLAKLYAGLAVTGQAGPAGRPDISNIDEGLSSYVRQYWMMQELTTDEAVISWNDGTVQDLHNLSWTSGSEYVTAMYNRIYYVVGQTNEFIREATDDRLSSRGFTPEELTNIRAYRAEARFLRAMAYMHALDLYGGNVPFVTETDAPGAFLPTQTNAQALFSYIESELKAIDADLLAPRTNEYGRADKAAAWTLLARLYLNAQVYTGTARNTDAVTYASQVIGANAYTLEPTYSNLFKADNNRSREIILPVAFDGLNTKTYGGTTFLVHGAIGGSMNAANYGVNSGWAGMRTTKALVNQFPDPTGATDRRAIFYSNGQNLEITTILNQFTDGYAVPKFTNITSTGTKGSDPAGDFVDTDFPLLRLADVYLMYAEAVVRGGTGGDLATALTYVNALRQRAYGNTSGNLTTLNLDTILSERARELYWEGYRRTDLIRFGRFTDASYLWPFKGGISAGRGVESYRRIFPIPASDLIANPNLKQSPGY
ncbi:RagB/SusD family nutrient uptake outer membrane protein [Spirosoma rhododendri]|uniref:RagB/SusD family nutrient uptake outer membrane protein n=1 Tax=Spirosoma rhododendri TaxID=2728024 RepID=A0A7L5DM40_9BACT|nr:RagB/SusD family nutrient uptake outer membrane protein [Spirosoma rhododendri]QJD77508.1 RagB/SusD family nutrient uptake outer membrane protein [Spirosoma rhododendri]